MYQFIHIEAYSLNVSKKKINKKYNEETKGRNVSDVINEAKRKPGFCDHVETPEEPIILYGVSPDEVEALAQSYFNNTKLTDSLGRPRALRKDANVLLAGVVSLNSEISTIWDDYKNDTIKYLQEKYGDALVSVVEHIDEENPHIHFYCVQKHGEKFDLLHDGKKAFSEVGGKIQYKKEKAFKEAMRTLQNDFFLKVAAGYGLMKTGPRRQRLTNEDYWNQKREVELINQHKNNSFEKIKEQEQKAKIEINSLKENAVALGRSIGKKEGFKLAVSEFNDKNYFNKLIFSKAFNSNTIENLEKRNKYLLDKNKNLFHRKEKYKAESKENFIYKNKYEEERRKVKYFEVINDFINDKKEVDYDIRRAIIAEIKAVEEQQQRLNKSIEQVKSRDDINVRKANRIGERVGKSFRVLFRNIRSFAGDFFSVELFERMFKEEKTENIKKYEYKETSSEEKGNIIKKDRRFTIK